MHYHLFKQIKSYFSHAVLFNCLKNFQISLKHSFISSRAFLSQSFFMEYNPLEFLRVCVAERPG